jgi:hypothetical protein
MSVLIAKYSQTILLKERTYKSKVLLNIFGGFYEKHLKKRVIENIGDNNAAMCYRNYLVWN